MRNLPPPGCRGPASILGNPPTAAGSPLFPPRPDCRSPRPRTRTPSWKKHTHAHTHIGGSQSGRSKRPLLGAKRCGRLQLIQHSLHLLVDLVGRRSARLLVLGSASLALRHAHLFGVGALGRLAASLSLAAAQGGGGRGHLRGRGRELFRCSLFFLSFKKIQFLHSFGASKVKFLMVTDEDEPGTSEWGPRSSSAGPRRRDEP